MLKMETQFEKNAYTPDETVKVVVDVDNSECKNDIEEFNVTLTRHIYLYCEGFSVTSYTSSRTFTDHEAIFSK
jgi:sporulation-control protein spo0M